MKTLPPLTEASDEGRPALHHDVATVGVASPECGDKNSTKHLMTFSFSKTVFLSTNQCINASVGWLFV
jgi:hypothetical protein